MGNEKKESARGSNLFFEGRSIYSYGYHFEVGRIVRNKCGEKAYLLNDKYYSSSTCKHQRCVRSAIPTGSKVFSVGYNMSDDGSMAFITSRLELIMAVNSNTIWYWIQPVTNGRSIAIRMIYWLLDVIGSHIARWRVLRDN